MPQLTGGKRETIYTPAVLMLVIIVGISFLGLGLVMPLRALYGRQIGASSTEIGLMTASFLLAGFLASPPVGWLADRFGYKNVLWIGLLLHALLMLAYIPVQDPVLLIGLRALEGIASVSVLPPTRAMMNSIAPRTRQGEALSLLSSAQTTGILIGPAVGAILASQTGYILSFVIASIPLVLAALVTLVLLPTQGKQENTSSESRRMVFAGLFTRPLIMVYTFQIVLMTTNGVVMAIWSLFMLDRGASLPVIGLSFTTFALPIIFIAPLAGRISDRYGRYWFFLLGLLVTGEGKVQANFSSAGLIGNLLGATAAGLLYGFAPGLPFFIGGLTCFAACLVLFLPGLARQFHSAHQKMSDVAQFITPEIAPEEEAINR